MKEIIKPIKKRNNPDDKGKNKTEDIYACNEAWSPFQGWVEGSLMATRAAFNRIKDDMGLQ